MNIFKKICKEIIFICLIGLCQLNVIHSSAQPRVFEKKNAFYIEALGNARLASLNYERIFNQSENMKTGIRLGYGFWISDFDNELFTNSILPIELNSLIGKDRHHLEFGIGTALNFEKSTTYYFFGVGPKYRDPYLSFHGRLGYRYQKPEGGFVFRLAFTPMFTRDNSSISSERMSKFYPWAGVSFGYSF